MPKVCTVCRHEQRQAIDKALAAGTSLRVVAKQNGTSAAALHRHRKHLSGRLVKAQEAKEAARADDLLASITALRERLQRALDDAKVARDIATVARELRETLRLLLELEGRLRQGAHVQVAVAVTQSPEFLTIQARLVSALARFPEARQAVLKALEADR